MFEDERTYQLPDSYVGTRLRFTDLADRKTQAGWLLRQRGRDFWIRPIGDPTVREGRSFSFDLTDVDHRAVFEAESVDDISREKRFRRTGSVTFCRPHEQPRYMTVGVHATLRTPDWVEPVELIDASSLGACCWVCEEVKVGTPIELDVPLELVHCRHVGEIRYSQYDRDRNAYRVGIEITLPDPSSDEAWLDFLQSQKVA